MKFCVPLLLLLAQTAAKPDSNLPYEEEIHSLNVSQDLFCSMLHGVC
jgi:hypothetical protein